MTQNVPENWEDAHGWYYYADEIRTPQYFNKAWKKDKTGSANDVKLCKKCNQQWQPRWSGTKGKLNFQYYVGLPTYGMKRETCFYCSIKVGDIVELYYNYMLIQVKVTWVSEDNRLFEFDDAWTYVKDIRRKIK